MCACSSAVQVSFFGEILQHDEDEDIIERNYPEDEDDWDGFDDIDPELDDFDDDYIDDDEDFEDDDSDLDDDD